MFKVFSVMPTRTNCGHSLRPVNDCEHASTKIFGVQDFKGRPVHIVQIGLGTNGTFIQNYANWDKDGDDGLEWILKCVSVVSPKRLTGIAVEPVAEHVQALVPMVKQSLPGVALVQCAIGDEVGESRTHFLSQGAHDELLMTVPWMQRDDLKRDLSYLFNMSSVGREHPNMQYWLKRLKGQYGVQLGVQQTSVDVWTFEKFALQLNFGGCEVLVVDAEGFDVRILRSMIAHCIKREGDENEDVWPHVIQFETQGHADSLDGTHSEWRIVSELEYYEYTLVYYSYCNTYLARTCELRYNQRVLQWARTLICVRCGRREMYPYLMARCDRKVYCQACSDLGYPSR